MKSFKIRLDLNNKQASYASKHAGLSRQAYNWGLDTCQKVFKNKLKHPSAIDLDKLLSYIIK